MTAITPPTIAPLTLPPLSLYIHLPWCVRKCPYCDFNSHQADRFETNGELPEDAYLAKLLADLDEDLLYVANRPIQSIFIGGGTPSLMSAAFYYQLITQLDARLSFVTDIEITMEANPGTFEQDKFQHFRLAGINRLSIGIQSFQPHLLTALGRIHGRVEAIQAVEKSRLAGFDNINIDLMHGLPEQSIEQAQQDLQLAIDLAPEHVSWYQLTIEPNTEFFRRPPTLPEDNTLWDIQDAGQALLERHGFSQYEVSANAQPNKQAKHNLNYWRFGDYLGIGCGSHGKLSFADGRIVRTTKVKHPRGYLAAYQNLVKPYLSDELEVTNEDRPFEFFMNRFRLMEACPKQDFIDTTGLGFDSIQETIEWAKELGYLNETDTHWQITEKGKLFLNDLLEAFMAEEDE